MHAARDASPRADDIAPDGRPRWTVLREQRSVLCDSVVARSFAQETILLNLRTGQYHGVDQVGSRFLEVMASSATLADAAEVLAAHFAQPVDRVQRDLTSFCDDLLAKALIELRSGD